MRLDRRSPPLGVDRHGDVEPFALFLVHARGNATSRDDKQRYVVVELAASLGFPGVESTVCDFNN